MLSRSATGIVAILLLFLFVSSTFAVIAPVSTFSSPKISGSLLSSGSDLQRVIVYGSGEIGALSSEMRVVYTLGGSSNFFAFGNVNRSSLANLASLPEVLKVFPDVKLDYNDSRLDTTGGLIQTDMYRVRSLLGADKVNSVLNVTGAGVKVAIVDTGTDFGNPELTGAIARDKNGVPLQLDPDGAGIILTNNTATKLVNATGVYLDLTKNGAGTKVYVYLGAAGYPLVVQWVRWNFFNFKIGTDPDHYIASRSGVYHFGIGYEGTPGGGLLFPTLVVDSKIAGAYDTVYVDLETAPRISAFLLGSFLRYNVTADQSFWGKPAHHIGDGSEAIAADFNGDGMPDISAGMIGARTLDVFGAITSAKSNFDYDIGALNGTLLAPMDPYGNYVGVMYDFQGHGTQTAANVASRGTNSYDIYANGTKYRLEGVAPGSQVIAVKGIYIGDIFYGWMWTSGFDYDSSLRQWVYSGKHRAELISNSWGISNWPILVSGMGYDVVSALEDALSVPKSLSPDYPGTLFFQAMGNGGPGYGTITNPASSSFAVSVGASTSWHVASQFSSTGIAYYGGNSTYHDDVISWSDRGPSPTGEPKPDIVNVGAFAFTPTAIMSSKGNGVNAWAFFGGTSQATPLTAGVGALVVQALSSKGKQFDPFLIKTILMSTAKDTGNDPFVQGAGRADALRAVSYALGGSSAVPAVFSASTNSTFTNVVSTLGGAEQSLSRLISQKVLIPATPQPEERWFAGMVATGGSASASFTITNPTGRSIRLEVESTSFELADQAQLSNTSIPGQSRFINLTRAVGEIPPGTDLMVVREIMPFNAWYNSSASPYYVNAVTRLRLQLYDWTDLNHDGLPELGEIALVNTNYGWGNAEEVRISNPLRKLTGTPLLGVFQNANLMSYWFGKVEGHPKPVHFEVYVYYLNRVSWSTISFDKGSLSLAPHSTGTLQASIKVPSDMRPGIYQGFMTLKGNNTQVTQVPVSFIVPVSADEKGVPYVFGGTQDNKGVLYDNGAVYGATDFSWRYESGNWRIFKVLVNDATVNQGVVRLDWSSPLTSINLFVLDPQGRIVATSVPPGIYKSITRSFVYILPISPSASNDYLGVSPYNNMSWGGGFAPSQNNGPTSTVLSFPVNSTGAYTLIVHNTVFSGTAPSETFTGEVELNTILPNQLTPTISVKIPNGTVSGIVRIPVNITGVGLTDKSYSIDSSPPKQLGSDAFIEVDTSRLSDGIHTLILHTADLVGHVATRTASFTVLNQSPSTFIGNPTHGSIVNGLLNVTFRASGDLITRVTLSTDNKSINVAPQGSYLWNTTSVKDGGHSVTLSAQNAAGKDSKTVVNFSTNNQALAQERARLRQELRVINTELTLAVAALAVSFIALAIVVARKGR